MRKSKVIKIDDREYLLKELTVKDVYELAQGDDLTVFDRIDDALARCSDISREQIFEMTPTDLLILWDGFKEANDSFLVIAGMVGLGNLPEMIKNNLQAQFAGSLPLDTE